MSDKDESGLPLDLPPAAKAILDNVREAMWYPGKPVVSLLAKNGDNKAQMIIILASPEKAREDLQNFDEVDFDRLFGKP